MNLEVTPEMVESAQECLRSPEDGSSWAHLADATYEAMIDQGIIEED